MPEPVSRLAQLRAGTRAAHDRIETVPVLQRLMAPDLSRAEYVVVLQHMHAFYAQIEPAIAVELASLPAALALLDGSRPRALADDLVWFAATPVQPPALPRLVGAAAALGALYVVEGSGLGGRVIGRQLAESLHVAQRAGASFYCGATAEAARQRWRALCAILDAPMDAPGGLGAADAADERMVAAAVETFRVLERWLRLIEVRPGCGHAVVEAVAA